MPTRTIAVVVGSNREDSINRRLARALERLAPEALRFQWLRIDDLPVFSQDHDRNPVDAVIRLKREIAAADGVLIVTPEHNRSLPAVLKNALDWGSRPYGQNAWAGKPAAIAGASVGAVGTAAAQLHLRGVLGYLDMPTMGQPEVYLQVTKDMFDADGHLVKADTEKFLRSWMETFVAWVNAHAREQVA